MRSISNIAAAAALVSVAAAGNAPVAESSNIGITYAATIPAAANKLSGAVKGSAAPDGAGTNFLISFYNLPGSGNLSYGLYTEKISNNDCATATTVLDPFGGITGAKCATDPASCQVGDLSDKDGAASILSGGSGTGYFSANFIDKYVSMVPGNQAFFGAGSFVVKDSTGTAVACANFKNADIVPKSNSTTSTMSSSAAMTTHKATGTGSSGSQNSGSSSSSSGFAVRTAAPVLGAGVLGLAAMFL